ncbi:MAG: PTS sugar transporter subunit IIB [Clostridium sp.]|nr:MULTISPECIES: PTS sugar transporter subunit IIB [Clostridium]MBS5307476.1 PTS sugar transporter subunit IIB [Clostridium sp.]MBS6502134.1 PTS sugar transporter subunit IIB [Clostridium sp.]MDB1943110.1 PTS sugar transporter subunit IIB [Clostridium tertium]MDB1950211.1 PTS sugar transporter subunit IIB [Clostridium tertium]MDU2158069.1 PTS sugar transporter subunit IIB [Clostridium sp.]
MENLLLARIDDRLIHGQVMTAWMKVMPAKKIIIVDNKAAKDDFMINVLELAAPSGVKVEVLNEEKAIESLKKGLSVPTIMLAKSPYAYKALVDRGININNINIGGMGMNNGRKTLFKNIAVTDEERDVLKDFISKGIEVKIQIIPAERVVDVKNII